MADLRFQELEIGGHRLSEHRGWMDGRWSAGSAPQYPKFITSCDEVFDRGVYRFHGSSVHLIREIRAIRGEFSGPLRFSLFAHFACSAVQKPRAPRFTGFQIAGFRFQSPEVKLRPQDHGTTRQQDRGPRTEDGCLRLVIKARRRRADRLCRAFLFQL
jgi:hypothetical protein